MGTFQERLSVARKKAVMTQKEIAEKLQMSQAGYAKYEDGSREPNLRALRLISEILSISTDYLICGTVKSDSTTAVSIEGFEIQITIRK